jgi:prepilin-type N-terminal cleavage/methylation domain-containing protein
MGIEGGFTLIEVMVTALIVVLISAAAAKALISSAQFSGDQRFRAEADGLATQDQERMRGLSDEQLGELDAASQARTETVNGQSFNVRSAASYVDTTGGSSCTSTAAAYYKIVSTVSWTESSQSQPVSVTEDSLLARPVTGFLLTDAQDQTLTPLAGVTINATGPDTQVGTTDANGCQLFAGLTPGSYTVTLTDPGYVDYSGNSTLTGTATVTLTGTTKTTGDIFTMGLAGSVAGSFSTASGDGAEADGISWSGNGAIGQPVKGVAPAAAAPATSPASTAQSQTSSALFPFDTSATGAPSYTNNYTVWPGRCPEQQPPSPTQVSVSPGQLNQAVPLTENELILNSVTYKSGTTTTTVKPAHVKLTFTGATCTDSWTPSITTATTMPATGWLANPGQPYAASGTLSVCVDYAPSTNPTFFSKATLPAVGNASATNTLSTIAITKGSTSQTC